MLINKMKKLKKIKLFGASALVGITSLSALAFIGCGATQSTKTTVATPIQKSTKSTTNPVNYSAYKFVTFKLRPEQESWIKYVGATSVKVKKGHAFGMINPPVALAEGFKLSYWELENNTPIYDSTIITEDIEVYPVMAPEAEDITITGFKTIYDGVAFDGTLKSQTTYDYKATIDGLTDYSDVTWSFASGQPQSDYLSIEQDSTNKDICHVTTKFISLNPGETCKKETIKATYKAGSTDEMSAEYEISIYPPYASTLTIDLGTTYGELNMGEVFWSSYTQNGIKKWAYSVDDTICWEVDDEADPSEIPDITLIIPLQNDGQGGEVSFGRSEESSSKGNWNDLYPGAAMQNIPDFFLGGVKKQYPTLHYGVNEITSIGQGFLLECSDFDQDINELFATYQPISLGSYFMFGCEKFNNADEPFILPNAKLIGDNFMGDCSALEGDLELPASTLTIGKNFLNDCHKINSFTITEDSDNVLSEVHEGFLECCDGLTSLTFDTEGVSYFVDAEKAGSTHGSFKTLEARDNPVQVYAKDPEVIDELMELYPNCDSSPYRQLANGSLVDVNVYDADDSTWVKDSSVSTDGNSIHSTRKIDRTGLYTLTIDLDQLEDSDYEELNPFEICIINEMEGSWGSASTPYKMSYADFEATDISSLTWTYHDTTLDVDVTVDLSDNAYIEEATITTEDYKVPVIEIAKTPFVDAGYTTTIEGQIRIGIKITDIIGVNRTAATTAEEIDASPIYVTCFQGVIG